MSRSHASTGPRPDVLDLPPGFEAVTLRELGDAMAHARTIAATHGAGTLVWVRRLDVVEVAVVLEPDVPLSEARCALYAVLNAAADALAAEAPPEKPITFEWPDTLLVDGAILGGARLAWPEGAREDVPPDWLVAGLVLRAVTPFVRAEKGAASHPLDAVHRRGTSLGAEGFEALDGARLISNVARHLMVQVDRWQQEGVHRVGQDFLARMPRTKGILRGIDGHGDLLVRQLSNLGDVGRHPLISRLASAGWMDPQTGEPWL